MFRMKNKSMKDMDKSKWKRNVGVYTVLGMALIAMAFFGVCSPTGQDIGPQGSAAVVGDEVISATDFRRAYQNEYQRLQQQYAEAFDPAAMRLSHAVIKRLVEGRVLYMTAAELGLRASDEEVLKVIRNIFKDKDGKFSEAYFKNYMSQNRYSEAGFVEEIRRSATIQKLQNFISTTSYVSTKEAEITYQMDETKIDAEYLKFSPSTINVEVTKNEIDKFLDEVGKAKVKDYYDTHAREFNQEEQVKARHILVSFKGARNAAADAKKRTKKVAEKQAMKALTQVKAAGANFAEIAKKTTDEPAGKKKGGDLGWFGKTAMVKEFSDAAFKLKKGQISGIVESPFGFHIIKVEGKKEGKKTSIKEATPKIVKTLIKKEKQPKLLQERTEKIMTALKEKKPVGTIIKKYGVDWKSTGDVSANTRYIPGIGSDKKITEAIFALSNANKLHDKIIDTQGSKYIVRLKNRKEADLSKLSDAKREEIASRAAMNDAYSLLSLLAKKAREELEKDKEIWLNPKYLAIDEQRREGPEEGDGG